MNVIVANKYQSMLEGLGIDVIKKKIGEFEVEDIINEFQNFSKNDFGYNSIKKL